MRPTVSATTSGTVQKKWPCQAPPWSHLTAINVNTGEFAWRVPFGSFEELDKFGVPQTGTPTTNAGGIATGGNLFFIGATMDGKFHAYDSRTGKVVWETDLGVNITSTPITWMGKNGTQYVAVFASGAPRQWRQAHVPLCVDVALKLGGNHY